MTRHRAAAVVVLLLGLAACGAEAEPAGPVLYADADGFFTANPDGAPASPGAVWRRGAGVRSVVPGGDGPCGRLEPGVEEATLYEERAGTLAAVRHVVRPAPEGIDPRARVRAGVEELLTWPTEDFHAWEILRSLHIGDAGPAAVPDVPPLEAAPGGGPPEPGADLAAWAPAGMLFARARTVSAAFHMAGELDRLLVLHALRQGHAEDRGTLRLTLHHLLLPTIWNTNPGADTGVSEVAVVVAPPFARGELRAAVLLRIDDRELHYMQTTAGISQENQPDHLWRPADDPFPASRVRHPHRSTVGDVEVVATDAALHALLAGGVAAPLLDDPGYRAARAAAGRPILDEALFVYVPPGIDRSADRLAAARRRALREEAGWRYLAAGWGADVDPVPTGALEPALFAADAAAPPTWLEGLAWMRWVTEPKGAQVTLALRDAAPESAGAWWSPEPVPGPACDRACAAGRELLGQLAHLDRRGAADPERAFVVLGRKPSCPLGGTFTVHPIDGSVRCTVHAGADAPRAGDGRPTHLHDLTLDPADPRRVAFRLEIDWRRRQ